MRVLITLQKKLSMPTSEQIDVKKLTLDLKNFRTTPQKNEPDAIKAMITIKPDKFYGVMESLLDDGYLLTENIQVLKKGSSLEVKEGNRRIGALKLILGYYKLDDYVIPSAIKERIKKVTKSWKLENEKVPCTIYIKSEIEMVNRIVSLAHGKGEKASRDAWNSVARARHNRDAKKGVELGLDILEKYLIEGKNLSGQQKERWGGEYNITVLEEAMRKLHPRMGHKSIDELVKKYPKIAMRAEFEELMRDIGLEQVTFPTIRNPQVDFGIAYGINPPTTVVTNSNSANSQNTTGKNGTGTDTSASNNSSGSTTTAANGNSSKSQTNSTPNTNAAPQAKKAHAHTDPKSVIAILKKFAPRGNNREKVVALRDELKNLKVEKNPIAFCFLLRSMFEISAKVYANEKRIPLTVTKTSAKGTNTKDKTLKELLQDVTNNLTSNNSNQAMSKTLHGAMTELSQPDRLLSVTSMNQLVHNDSFSVAPQDICRLFNKVYPLLEQMN